MTPGETLGLMTLIVTVGGGFLGLYAKIIRTEEKVVTLKRDLTKLEQRHDKLLDFVEKKL